MRHDQKAVIVTGGAGRGSGRAISSRFAASGAPVVVSDIDEVGGDETVSQIHRQGLQAVFRRADVCDENEVKQLIAFASERFGGLAVLINNATCPHTGEGMESWTKPLQTDLLGAIHATRWAIESMKETGGGSIVNIASISALWHGRTTPGGLAGYDVAKAGMIRMTTRLRSYAESDGIRINCFAPGWIGTEDVRAYWESLSSSDRKMRSVPETLLTPAQVAGAVFQLAHDKSLAGRVLVWWSEKNPRLIRWGDRGYRDFDEYELTDK